MDLADYGPTWRFIRAHIKKAGAVRGSRHQAIKEAAKAFRIDYKTAERRYERIRKFGTPELWTLLAKQAVAKQMPEVDGALILISAAFSQDEREELASVGSDFVLQLARERLELMELRKRRMRK